MPRKTTVQNNFTFEKGLITDGNDILAPEGSARGMENLHIHDDGSISKRYGIRLDSNGANNVSMYAYANQGTVVKHWNNPNQASVGLTKLNVVRVGEYLLFFTAEDGDYLGYFPIERNVLSGYTTQDVRDSYVSFTEVNGQLIVACEVCNLAVLDGTYAVGTRYTDTPFSLTIRDLEGDTSVSQLQNRAGSITASHRYNLINQGWLDRNVTVLSGTSSPIDNFFNSTGTYPSSFDIVHLGKILDSATAADINKFDPNWLLKYGLGNTPAPKGLYTLDAFAQDRNARVSGAVSTPISTRPSAVEYYAGRVWYGLSYGDVGTTLYFSQVVFNDAAMVKCYQENDPTSEYAPDLLPSDGGTIHLANCTKVYYMQSLEDSLLVYTDAGIYEIRGSSGGFSADSYRVDKLSDLQVISPGSICLVDDLPVFWTADGIFVGKRENVTGKLYFTSITDGKIQRYIDTIPIEAKRTVCGIHDPSTYHIVFTFTTSVQSRTGTSDYLWGGHNTVLIYDVKKDRYEKHEVTKNNHFATEGNCILGVMPLDVASTIINDPRGPVKYAFLGAVRTSGGIVNINTAHFSDNTYFFDWENTATSDNDYDAYWISNPITFSDLARDKKIMDMTVISHNFDYNSPSIPSDIADLGSRCLVGAEWDWDHAIRLETSSRTYHGHEGYRLKRSAELDQDTIATKISPRGKGNEVTVIFEAYYSVSGEVSKPMHILGYAMTVSGEVRA